MQWACGIVGVEPWNWSMRDLFGAARAKWRHDWDLVAASLWLVAEVNRDRKRRPRPFTPADFHPETAGGKQAAASNRTRLTPGVFRAQARAWFESRGLPIPEKLR